VGAGTGRAGGAFIVALTGGIASGKSAATAEFRRHGVAIHDADLLAREFDEPGGDALDDIARTFGGGVLTGDGRLDRHLMRERVFANADDRRRLEAILHPRVRAALVTAARDCTGPYCLLVVPLLAELHAEYAFVDRVLVVDASADVQIARLMNRDRADADAALRIVAAQASRTQRLAIADDVIDNDGALALLAPRIARLHRLYEGLARARQGTSEQVTR
jgi:dephospho-CoA kinase